MDDEVVTDVPETEPIYQYRTWEKGPAKTQCTKTGFCFLCQYLESSAPTDGENGTETEYDEIDVEE